MKKYLTAILHKEEDMYVALCPELDIASQGRSIEEAKKNLEEAVELFFEVASTKEMDERLKNDIFITPAGFHGSGSEGSFGARMNVEYTFLYRILG